MAENTNLIQGGPLESTMAVPAAKKQKRTPTELMTILEQAAIRQLKQSSVDLEPAKPEPKVFDKKKTARQMKVEEERKCNDLMTCFLKRAEEKVQPVKREGVGASASSSSKSDLNESV